jgi:hypothetical protein
MDPKTAPRTFTGNGGSELPVAAAPAAAVVVEAATGEVWAGDVGADEDEEEEEEEEDNTTLVGGIDAVSICSVSAAESIFVALTHVFFLVRNMHNTSFSFPPDITTKPLWSCAIE